MINEVAAALEDEGALLIESSDYFHPQLNFHGEGWSFNTTSAWRVLDDRGALVFAWCTRGAPELVAQMVGLSIVGVSEQGRVMPGDPCFHLSDGRFVEVFSDDVIDPWVLRLPTITFVGSPSDMSRP